MGIDTKVSIEEQIAYLARRNEYTLSPRSPGLSTESIEEAILATLRQFAQMEQRVNELKKMRSSYDEQGFPT